MVQKKFIFFSGAHGKVLRRDGKSCCSFLWWLAYASGRHMGSAPTATIPLPSGLFFMVLRL